MEIKKKNLVAAYNTADDSGKKMLQALFPEAQFETPQTADDRPVTERIKTFADAYKAVGIDDPEEWEENYANVEPDILAYFKLCIICKALNEGWEPQFTTEERRYYHWFWLYTEQDIEDMDEDDKNDCRMMNTGDYVTDYAGFGSTQYNNIPLIANAYIGARLCLKTPELATYCGKQFIDIWADYLLIRRTHKVSSGGASALPYFITEKTDNMEIKKEQALAAYEVADENGKKILEALFGEETFKVQDDRPVTERIKTFADACKAVGIDDPEEWEENYANVEPDILAYSKLRIICQALNEGWEPQFTTEERRYYPWFSLYTEQEIEDMDEDDKNDRRMMNTGDYVTDYAGFGCTRSVNPPSDARSSCIPSRESMHFGSRLCLKTPELATYCGKQFIDIWADFQLTRK